VTPDPNCIYLASSSFRSQLTPLTYIHVGNPSCRRVSLKSPLPLRERVRVRGIMLTPCFITPQASAPSAIAPALHYYRTSCTYAHAPHLRPCRQSQPSRQSLLDNCSCVVLIPYFLYICTTLLHAFRGVIPQGEKEQPHLRRNDGKSIFPAFRA
jgi:hypothetical protein